MSKSACQSWQFCYDVAELPRKKKFKFHYLNLIKISAQIESVSPEVLRSKEREDKGQKLQTFITEETPSVGPRGFLMSHPRRGKQITSKDVSLQVTQSYQGLPRV